MNALTIHVRREFWEHKSLWVAPLVWASIITLMFAWVIFAVIPAGFDSDGLIKTPSEQTLSQMSESDREEVKAAIAEARRHQHDHAPTAEQKDAIFSFSYLAITAMVSLFMWIVVFFYLIDCLYAERRDRSILFWKSLPISDAQVVLSKLAVALVVVPLGVLALAAVMQILIAFMVWARFHGTGIAEHIPDWSIVSWFKSMLVALIGSVGGVLWFAPIAGYLLLASSWARRNVFLWAVLPPLAVVALEGFFLHSTHVLQFIGWRLSGFVRLLSINPSALSAGTRSRAEDVPQITDVLSQINLSGLFLSADLWIGLAIAAAMVFVAIRLRRHRDES